MHRWLLDAHLRLSFSSELGAATAYGGHAAHVKNPADRPSVAQVREDELHHRAELGRMMEARGVRPWWALELLFLAIGSTVAFGCRWWGDWASATGAAMFEYNGVTEYERLAGLARRAGAEELLPCFQRMAAQEQAHRDLFLAMAAGKALLPSQAEK
jgi:demethoxyubiquinone hydroxylase (CLK1/Coq7/Cat5 family)